MEAAEGLEDLYRRLAILEDERAIRTLLVRYALATDSHDLEEQAKLYTDDFTMEFDGKPFDMASVGTDLARSDAPNVFSHIMGPYVIEIDGNRAVATGYANALLLKDGASTIWRQAVGRWEMVKCDGEWRICRRQSSGAGRDDAIEILKGGLG